jgi:hypothetical protein
MINCPIQILNGLKFSEFAIYCLVNPCGYDSTDDGGRVVLIRLSFGQNGNAISKTVDANMGSVPAGFG